MIKICKNCGKEFIAKLDTEKYCSNKQACISKNRKNKRSIINGKISKRKPVKSFFSKANDKSRDRNYFNSYGITLEDYEKKYLEQEGKCEVCKNPQPTLFVDHNHKTGKIRGLLCPSCNAGLGCFKDSTKIMQNAVIYLHKYR